MGKKKNKKKNAPAKPKAAAPPEPEAADEALVPPAVTEPVEVPAVAEPEAPAAAEPEAPAVAEPEAPAVAEPVAAPAVAEEASEVAEPISSEEALEPAPISSLEQAPISSLEQAPISSEEALEVAEPVAQEAAHEEDVPEAAPTEGILSSEPDIVAATAQAELCAEPTDQSSAIIELECQLKAVKAAKDVVNSKLLAVTEQHVQLESQLTQRDESLAQLLAQKLGAQDKMADLESQLAQRDDSLEQLLAQKLAAQDEVADLESQLAQRDESLEQLLAQKLAAQGEMAAANEAVGADQEAAEEMEHKLIEAQAQLDDASTKAEATEQNHSKELAALRAELEASRQAGVQHEHDLIDKDKALHSAQQQLDALEAPASNDHCEDNMLELAAKLALVGDQLSEAVAQGEAAEKENGELVESLKAQIAILTPKSSGQPSRAAVDADVLAAITEADADVLLAAQAVRPSSKRDRRHPDNVTPEIARLVSWVDSDGDGEIDMREFEGAIRRFRRLTNAKAVAKEREGRTIMLKLGAAMKKQGLNQRQFFTALDKSGDGLVAGYELRKGLLCQQLVTAAEADLVCHYMDPNADDAVEFHELEMAFKRSAEAERSAETEAQVGELFRQLESEMEKNQLRIVDLLRQVDVDGSGRISAQELEQWLATACFKQNAAVQETPAALTTADYRAQAVAIYKKYNPDKLGGIDKLMQANVGREAVLVSKLRAKYVDEADAAPAEGMDYRARVVEIYQDHNPEKLANVDSLIESYQGREQELVDKLEVKYGISGDAAPAATPGLKTPRSKLGTPSSGSKLTIPSPRNSKLSGPKPSSSTKLAGSSKLKMAKPK